MAKKVDLVERIIRRVKKAEPDAVETLAGFLKKQDEPELKQILASVLVKDGKITYITVRQVLVEKIESRIKGAKPNAKAVITKVIENATQEELEEMLKTLRVADGGGIAYGEVWILDTAKKADNSGSQPRKKEVAKSS